MNRRLLAVPAAALGGALLIAGCGSSSAPSAGSMPGHTMGSASTQPGAAVSMMPSAMPSSMPSGMTPMPESDGATGAATTGAHNAADVAFATGMIPHHAQAIEMADMATKQASSAKVTTLAAAIKAAQGPEIATMSGWLTSWGAPVSDPTSHDMGGMDMGGTMMSAQDMTALGKASGKAFDTMWLQMMVKHHQGAITMAKQEQTAGSNPDAIALAGKIIADQTAEIATMQVLLKSA